MTPATSLLALQQQLRAAGRDYPRYVIESWSETELRQAQAWVEGTSRDPLAVCAPPPAFLGVEADSRF